MFNLRKIGGMYWISIGSLRIMFCVAKVTKPVRLPTVAQIREYGMP